METAHSNWLVTQSEFMRDWGIATTVTRVGDRVEIGLNVGELKQAHAAAQAQVRALAQTRATSAGLSGHARQQFVSEQVQTWNRGRDRQLAFIGDSSQRESVTLDVRRVERGHPAMYHGEFDSRFMVGRGYRMNPFTYYLQNRTTGAWRDAAQHASTPEIDRRLGPAVMMGLHEGSHDKGCLRPGDTGCDDLTDPNAEDNTVRGEDDITRTVPGMTTRDNYLMGGDEITPIQENDQGEFLILPSEAEVTTGLTNR